MAAANQSTGMLKVNQISKDLNLKSKDLADFMAGEGIEYKAQKTLTPVEFAIIFDKLTKDNQINGIEDYLDGITYIPSKKANNEEKPKKEEKVEAEPAQTVQPSKVEEKKQEEAKPLEKPSAEPVKKAEEKLPEVPKKPEIADKVEKTEKVEARTVATPITANDVFAATPVVETKNEEIFAPANTSYSAPSSTPAFFEFTATEEATKEEPAPVVTPTEEAPKESVDNTARSSYQEYNSIFDFIRRIKK